MKRIVMMMVSLVGAMQISLSAQEVSQVGIGYAKTSVNTTVFRANSVTTHDGEQYTAYYDEQERLVLAKRKSDGTTWTVNTTQYRGKCSDAHNVISIAVDGDGYVHVSWDHHGHPLRYAKSVAPGSLTLGEKETMIGDRENKVTYPEFYNIGDGDLLFAYRDGSSGNGNLVLNRYDRKSKTWKRIHSTLIDGEGKRNAYWQMCVDAKGTIHVAWVWRETWMVETNHDLCYACSHDGGVTWLKTDGTQYTLPITADNAEYAWRIPQKSELINQSGMSADNNGHPFITTYWRDEDSKVPQYRMIWYDGNRWQMRQVMERKTPFTLSGGGTKMIPISRPRMAVKQQGKRYEAYYIFRDNDERGGRVSVAYSKDILKGRWKVKDITDYSVGAWEATYDTNLWNSEGKLDIFVQKSNQGDGEKTVESAGEPVTIIRCK